MVSLLQEYRNFPPSGTSRLFDTDARRRTLQEMEQTLAELGQAYREIAIIKRKMVGMRAALLRLKAQLNTFTFISAVPPELLEEIFCLCLCQHFSRKIMVPLECPSCTIDYGRLPPNSPILVRKTLSKVSTAWALSVKSFPKMWTTIDFGAKERRVSESLLRSSRMPLTIHGLGREVASESLRRVLKRLHRVEELRIASWAGSLEMPLMKYADRQAPILRTLVVFYKPDRESIASSQLPFILSSPCPALEFLRLLDFGIHSIRPAFLPALQELCFEQYLIVPTPLDEILSVLEGLPQLTSLTFAQTGVDESYWPRSNLTLNAAKKIVILQNLRSLTLSSFSIHLLLMGHLQAPSLEDITLNTHNRLLDSATQHFNEDSLITDWLALHASRTACSIADSPGAEIPSSSKLRIYTLASPLRHAFELSVAARESLVLRCKSVCHRRSCGAVAGLCRAIRPLCVREFKLSAISAGGDYLMIGKRDWSDILPELPLVEVLDIHGERASISLLSALAEAYSTLGDPAWPLQKLDTLILRPTPVRTSTRLQVHRQQYAEKYVAKMTRALTARQSVGLTLRKLQFDAEGRFSEDEFQPLVPLVTEIALHRTQPGFNWYGEQRSSNPTDTGTAESISMRSVIDGDDVSDEEDEEYDEDRGGLSLHDEELKLGDLEIDDDSDSDNLDDEIVRLRANDSESDSERGNDSNDEGDDEEVFTSDRSLERDTFDVE